jgi:hypothetical protein
MKFKVLVYDKREGKRLSRVVEADTLENAREDAIHEAEQLLSMTALSMDALQALRLDSPSSAMWTPSKGLRKRLVEADDTAFEALLLGEDV